MLLLEAVLKVHVILEKLIPLPYKLNRPELSLTANKDFTKTHHKLARLLLINYLKYLICPIVFYYNGWLFFHWDTFTINHISQAVLYAVYFFAIAILITSCKTTIANFNEIIYFVNQIFKLEFKTTTNSHTFVPHKLKSNLSKILAKENFVYGFCVCLSTLPLAFLLSPFKRSYTPLQLLLGQSLLVKCLDAIFDGALFLYGLKYASSLIFIQAGVLEQIDAYSLTMFSKITIENVILRKCFRQAYHKFRVTTLFCKIFRNIFDVFDTVLIFVGILLASGMSFIMLKLYHVLPIPIFVAAPAALIICFAVAIILTDLGGRCYKNGVKFKEHWKLIAVKKEERRVLRSCPVIGYQIGPYGLVTSKLGLLICNDIIDNAVNLVLMGTV